MMETVLYGASSKDSWKPLVQVVVRSDPNDYADGAQIARQINDGLRDASPTDYLGCAVQQAAPIYLEKDSADSHHFSVLVELW